MEKWKTLTGEMDAVSINVKFTDPSNTDTLSKAAPRRRARERRLAADD